MKRHPCQCRNLRRVQVVVPIPLTNAKDVHGAPPRLLERASASRDWHGTHPVRTTHGVWARQPYVHAAPGYDRPHRRIIRPASGPLHGRSARPQLVARHLRLPVRRGTVVSWDPDLLSGLGDAFSGCSSHDDGRRTDDPIAAAPPIHRFVPQRAVVRAPHNERDRHGGDPGMTTSSLRRGSTRRDPVSGQARGYPFPGRTRVVHRHRVAPGAPLLGRYHTQSA